MHKKILVNVMMIQFLLLCMSSMFFLPLCSMDEAPADAFREIMTYTIIPQADLHTQRTLAQLNKTYNKIIEDNHRPQKKRIEELMRAKGVFPDFKQASWNKDFSRYAWVTITPFKGKKQLSLFLCQLNDMQEIVDTYYSWQGYMCPVIDDTIRPLFNEKGEAFCYGYGWHAFDYSHKAIVKYSIHCNGIQHSRCVIGINKNGVEEEYRFDFLLSFPALLKAFLQSTQVSTKGRTSGETIEVYNIGGVTIPENYKDCKKNMLGDMRYESYDKFYSYMREAIDKKYTEQQQSEKKMIEDAKK